MIPIRAMLRGTARSGECRFHISVILLYLIVVGTTLVTCKELKAALAALRGAAPHRSNENHPIHIYFPLLISAFLQ